MIDNSTARDIAGGAGPGRDAINAILAGSEVFSGLTLTKSSDSTSGSDSVEPLQMNVTLTGVGGVGGRARFRLDSNVALGGWANALKGITVFGASGRVTGLASGIVGELQLSAGTTQGTYAPIESEIVLPASASTGTASSFFYGAASGANVGAFDDNGFAFELAGLTKSSGHLIQASAVTGVNSTDALKVRIAGVTYYIPLHTSETFAS
jgi:hypothetical protein